MSSERWTVDPQTGCWNWLLGKDKDGYGKVKVAGRDLRAHRYIWSQNHGELKTGEVVCHRCDNPSCVNPDHLFVGTHQDNHADRNGKGRTAAGERHGRSKLSADDVAAIRVNRPGYREALAKYGIGKTHYHRILRGEAWRNEHVV